MKSPSFQRISWVATILLLCLSPLIMSRWVANCFQVPKFVLLLTLGIPLAAWGFFDLGLRMARSFHPRHNAGEGLELWEWCILAKGSILTLSTLASLSLSISFWGDPGRCHGWISRILILGVSLVIYRSIRGNVGGLRQLMMGVVLAGVPISLYALLQVAGMDPLIPGLAGERPCSTLGNAAFLGDITLFTLFSAWGLILTERRSWLHACWFAAMALSGLALFCSLARAAWLGACVGALVFLFFFFRKSPDVEPRPEIRKHLLGGTLASIVLMMTIFLFLTGQGSIIFQRAWNTFFLDPTGTGRVLLWEDSIRLARKYWLLGCGPEAFAVAFLPERSLSLARFNPLTRYDHAHCELLHCLCTEGILGLSAFLALAAVGFRGLLRSIKSDSQRHLALALLASLAAYGTTSLFSLHVLSTSLLWHGFLAAGAAMALSGSRPVLSLGPLGKSMLTGLAIFGAFLSGKILWADHCFSVGNGYLYVGNKEKASTWAQKASWFAPWNADYRMLWADSLAPHEHALHLYDHLLQHRTSNQPDLVLEKKALCQFSREEAYEALSTVETLLALDPFSSAGHLLRSYILFDLSRFHPSLESVERTRFLDPWDPNAFHLERLVSRICEEDPETSAKSSPWERLHPTHIRSHHRLGTLLLLGTPDTGLTVAPPLASSNSEIFFPVFRNDLEWNTCLHLHSDSESPARVCLEVYDQQGLCIETETWEVSREGISLSSVDRFREIPSGWVHLRSDGDVFAWQILESLRQERVVLAPCQPVLVAGIPLLSSEESMWLGVSIVNPALSPLSCHMQILDQRGHSHQEERFILSPRTQRLLLDGVDLIPREGHGLLMIKADKPFLAQAVMGSLCGNHPSACGISDLSPRNEAFFPVFGCRYSSDLRLLAANPHPTQTAFVSCSLFREEDPIPSPCSIEIPPRTVIDLVPRLPHQDAGLLVQSSLDLFLLQTLRWKDGPRPGWIVSSGEKGSCNPILPTPQEDIAGFLAMLPIDPRSNRIQMPFRFFFRGRVLFPTNLWKKENHP